jgi:hypothetical protein
MNMEMQHAMGKTLIAAAVGLDPSATGVQLWQNVGLNWATVIESDMFKAEVDALEMLLKSELMADNRPCKADRLPCPSQLETEITGALPEKIMPKFAPLILDFLGTTREHADHAHLKNYGKSLVPSYAPHLVVNIHFVLAPLTAHWESNYGAPLAVPEQLKSSIEREKLWCPEVLETIALLFNQEPSRKMDYTLHEYAFCATMQALDDALGHAAHHQVYYMDSMNKCSFWPGWQHGKDPLSRLWVMDSISRQIMRDRIFLMRSGSFNVSTGFEVIYPCQHSCFLMY